MTDQKMYQTDNVKDGVWLLLNTNFTGVFIFLQGVLLVLSSSQIQRNQEILIQFPRDEEEQWLCH